MCVSVCAASKRGDNEFLGRLQATMKNAEQTGGHGIWLGPLGKGSVLIVLRGRLVEERLQEKGSPVLQNKAKDASAFQCQKMWVNEWMGRAWEWGTAKVMPRYSHPVRSCTLQHCVLVKMYKIISFPFAPSSTYIYNHSKKCFSISNWWFWCKTIKTKWQAAV